MVIDHKHPRCSPCVCIHWKPSESSRLMVYLIRLKEIPKTGKSYIPKRCVVWFTQLLHQKNQPPSRMRPEWWIYCNARRTIRIFIIIHPKCCESVDAKRDAPCAMANECIHKLVPSLFELQLLFLLGRTRRQTRNVSCFVCQHQKTCVAVFLVIRCDIFVICTTPALFDC